MIIITITITTTTTTTIIISRAIRTSYLNMLINLQSP
jgi:hypothetical protein